MRKIFFVCLLSFAFCAFGYTSEDVSNAQFLADKGIIVKQSTIAGYRLDDTITRAEAVGINLKIKGVTFPNNYTCKNYFIDAPYNPVNNWICRAVELAADSGIISRANIKGRPGDAITRSEVFAMTLYAALNNTLSIVPKGYKFSADTVEWQQNIFYAAEDLITVIGTNYNYNTRPISVNYFPNRNATRAEVFDFARNILSDKNACNVGPIRIEQPCEIENEFIRYGRHIEVLTYGDETYKGPECLIRYEETGSNPVTSLKNLGIVKYQDGSLDAQYIEAGGFRAVFTSTGYYRISSSGNVNNCMDVALPNRILLYSRDVLKLYYENLNTEGGSYWAYLMRSPAGVSLKTFESWYQNVTNVTFREDTLKDLGSNTYEFLVDMTENGVKSTYKVKSKVDLENFKINNLSSVKQ